MFEKLTLLPNNGFDRIFIKTIKTMKERDIYPRVNPMVNAITIYVAGKTPSENNRAFKMSSNENPLGPSKKVILSMKEGYKGLERYPDTMQTDIKTQVANVHNLKEENLVFGNGSDEFFHLVCSIFLSRGDESIICEHGFLLYKSQILASGAVPVIIKETDGKIKVYDIIRAITDRTKLVFITVPTNPTGTFLTLRELHLLRRILPTRIALLIDSAYAEFVIDDRYNDGKAIYQKNIIMTRTFSKIYGLAAIRIGWMHADREYIIASNKVRSPFNVNKIAQMAGAIAINDPDSCWVSAKFNLFWITKIMWALRKKKMLLHYSSANFVIIKAPKKVPIDIIEEYFEINGIITRQIADYRLFNCIRTSLGPSNINNLLVDIIINIDNMKVKKTVFRTSTSSFTTYNLCKKIETTRYVGLYKMLEAKYGKSQDSWVTT
ncbi:Histidinol-phosphate aminotransferase [Candidatus Hodgkinia cicadicola]|nr:Histidinol-phosphate aminotransferase [Candidatus Hodgkinia cicadicola]